jgi:hypothetical protein
MRPMPSRQNSSHSQNFTVLVRYACYRVPAGLEDVSKYPDLFDRLAESRTGEPAWSSEDLQKLAGLNFIRVLEEVEKVSYSHNTWFYSCHRLVLLIVTDLPKYIFTSYILL